jgi:hypothetical protein
VLSLAYWQAARNISCQILPPLTGGARDPIVLASAFSAAQPLDAHVGAYLQLPLFLASRYDHDAECCAEEKHGGDELSVNT